MGTRNLSHWTPGKSPALERFYEVEPTAFAKRLEVGEGDSRVELLARAPGRPQAVHGEVAHSGTLGTTLPVGVNNG